MKYTDLTLNQRISLKGEFQTNPECVQYKAIMLLWNFVIAIEFFLNDDINILIKNMDKNIRQKSEHGAYHDVNQWGIINESREGGFPL